MTKLKKAYRTQDRHTLTPLEESLKQERLGYPPGVPPQHTNIMNVTARDIHAPVIGAVDRSRLKINSTSNDLSAIGALVNEMLAHIQELHLPQQQHMHLSAQLSAIQREMTSHTPNHPRLRGALVEVGHTLRHLAEAGTAHVLVGHWREILHRL
jgi:hypothetical protein